jgi:hypothetical protein
MLRSGVAMKIPNGSGWLNHNCWGYPQMQAEVVGDIILNSGGHLELKGKAISNLFPHKGTCRMMWGA